MSDARERILMRVRRALGKESTTEASLAEARATIAAHRQGPRPTLPWDRAALADVFVQQALRMATTVERLADRALIPAAVSRYLDSLALPPMLAEQRSHHGVCWPEFAELDWTGSGLSIEARPTRGADRTGITGCFCAIAETGTLVLVSGAETPTGSALLPDTHVAVLRTSRIVAGMEDAFALIRAELGAMPRAVNLISGPSRTGDIEQTIVLGAHGPYRVHVLLLD